jgi:hypothetical protein
MDNFLKYLKHSNSNSEKNPIGDFYVQGKRIYIKDNVHEDVEVKKSFEYVLGKIPPSFYSKVDRFVIGQFHFLKKREVDAIYKNNCIYITNLQDSNETLIADIVHEIAHAFEDLYREELYADEQIEQEFLSKRKSMLEVLKRYNLVSSFEIEQKFSEIEYDQSFDELLYKTIGYEKIASLCSGIFISPYSATCLREYFANAFENFFVEDVFTVKRYCPSIYKKLVNFLEF